MMKKNPTKYINSFLKRIVFHENKKKYTVYMIHSVKSKNSCKSFLMDC